MVWKDNTQVVGKQHLLTIASEVTAEGPQDGPTKVRMVHERIELTTGKASIILEGPNIMFKADNDISATALMHIALLAAVSNISVTAGVGKVAVLGATGVDMTSPSIVAIDGVSGVFINCKNPASQATIPDPSIGEVAKNAAIGGIMGAVTAAGIAAAPVVGVIIGASMAGVAISDGLSGG